MNANLFEYPKFDYEYEKSVVRKEYDTVEEVFGGLRNISVSKSNAFLWGMKELQVEESYENSVRY